jgi:hypothetical protein
MSDNYIPGQHPDPWVNLLRDYVTNAVRSLIDYDFKVDRSWLDPSGPRDATILYVPESGSPDDLHALVWDEEAGWRTGQYVSGEQGVRTRLTDVAYVGGGVLPASTELAARVIGEAVGPRAEHRSHTDLRDGLDDALRDQAFVR